MRPPLIIEGVFTPAGGEPKEFVQRIPEEAPRSFALEGSTFELIDYEWGTSMHLRYLGRAPR